MRRTSLILCSSLAAILGCGEELNLPSDPSAGSPPSAATAAAVADSVILMVAGDMHTDCGLRSQRASKTAAIVAKYPQALVIPLGDNAGDFGTRQEYQCYDQSWGKFKSRTYAVLGNHELSVDPNATPYYDYFNGVGVDSGRAGQRGRAYYTLNYGGWRIFVANNNYRQPLEEQEAWLIRELAARPTRCVMALWHRPLFVSSSQPAGVHKPSILPRWWKALYNGRAELILTGHSHLYERFAQMRSDGVVDTARGIREFVVGTGGSGLYAFDAVPQAGSLKRIRAWGVLKLTLWPTRYKWQFIDVAGVVRDSGSDVCH